MIAQTYPDVTCSPTRQRIRRTSPVCPHIPGIAAFWARREAISRIFEAYPWVNATSAERIRQGSCARPLCDCPEAHQTPRTSSVGDRQSGFPSLPALPVNCFSPFHGDHNGE